MNIHHNLNNQLYRQRHTTKGSNLTPSPPPRGQQHITIPQHHYHIQRQIHTTPYTTGQRYAPVPHTPATNSTHLPHRQQHVAHTPYRLVNQNQYSPTQNNYSKYRNYPTASQYYGQPNLSTPQRPYVNIQYSHRRYPQRTQKTPRRWVLRITKRKVMSPYPKMKIKSRRHWPRFILRKIKPSQKKSTPLRYTIKTPIQKIQKSTPRKVTKRLPNHILRRPGMPNKIGRKILTNYFKQHCQNPELQSQISSIRFAKGLKPKHVSEASACLSTHTLERSLSPQERYMMERLADSPKVQMDLLKHRMKDISPEYKHCQTFKVANSWPDFEKNTPVTLEHHATGIAQAANILEKGAAQGPRQRFETIKKGFYTAPFITDELIENYGKSSDNGLGIAVMHFAIYGNITTIPSHLIGPNAKSPYTVSGDGNVLVPYAITVFNKNSKDHKLVKDIFKAHSQTNKNKAKTFSDWFPVVYMDKLSPKCHRTATTNLIIDLWKKHRKNGVYNFLRELYRIGLPPLVTNTVKETLLNLNLSPKERFSVEHIQYSVRIQTTTV